MLRNFRNFSDVEFDFYKSGALISGENGTGKTNLLEAISFFAFGKSFRNCHDTDLINFSSDHLHIRGEFVKNEHILQFESGIEKNRKKISLNGSRINRTSNLYKFIKTVYFSPEDVEFLSGAPVFRRNFLDQALSQYSFSYLELLRRYSHILKQRNILLKTEYENAIKKSWDKQLINYGSKLIDCRLKYLDSFIPRLQKNYQCISANRENLSLKYRYSFPRRESESLSSDLEEYLEEIAGQEKETGHTLAGPHLDDLQFEIDNHPVRSFASQGQKRSTAISARLVQAEMIRVKDSETPILMFDDVLADLDKIRTRNIIKLLHSDHQIFIASPNAAIYKDFKLKEIKLELLP